MVGTDDIDNFCVGCGLCASLDGNAVMALNDRGFVRPQNLSEKSRTQLQVFCPVFTSEKFRAKGRFNSYGQAFFGWSNDKGVRFRGSSGGTITAIAIYLLEKKLVDGIVQLVPSARNSFGCESAITATVMDAKRATGSRYVSAAPLEAFSTALEGDGIYAVIGRPCDVRAVRLFLEKNEDLRQKFPYTLSFFCAASPSTNATDELLACLKVAEEDLVNVSYRGSGWPGQFTAKMKDGDIRSVDYETAWGSYLGRNTEQFCRFCPDGIGESADISCGDGWYITAQDTPDFTEHPGRNIIFSHSENGARLLQRTKMDGCLTLEELDEVDGYLRVAQNFQYNRRANLYYRLIGASLLGKRPNALEPASFREFRKDIPMVQGIRIALGTCKRIFQGLIRL